MSENRIDVMAVFDTDIAEHERLILRGVLLVAAYDSGKAKRQARDAIAELIEADKEYDAANLALQTIDARDFTSDWECDVAYDALCDRFDAASSRRAAALARVTPELTKDFHERN